MLESASRLRYNHDNHPAYWTPEYVNEAGAGEESGADDDSKNPYNEYFHTTWRGEKTEAAHTPVHSREFLGTFERKYGTRKDAESMHKFLTGAPYGAQESSYVRSCPDFPYCPDIPPPPPTVPAPWKIPAPNPNRIYPSLAEPHHPFDWEWADRVEYLSRVTPKVRQNLVKIRTKAKKKAEQEMVKYVHEQGAIPNPEKLSYKQHTLSPSDERKWQETFLAGSAISKKTKFNGGKNHKDLFTLRRRGGENNLWNSGEGMLAEASKKANLPG
eukprot:g108.t1